MIPGIGTIVNGVGVLFVGILSRIIFKKEVKKKWRKTTRVFNIWEQNMTKREGF